MKEVPQVPDALDTSNPIIWYILCLIANQLGGIKNTKPQYSDQDKPISYNVRKKLSVEAETKSRKI